MIMRFLDLLSRLEGGVNAEDFQDIMTLIQSAVNGKPIEEGSLED